jgi:hypothetical protein
MVVLWVLQLFNLDYKDSQFMGAKGKDEVDIHLIILASTFLNSSNIQMKETSSFVFFLQVSST